MGLNSLTSAGPAITDLLSAFRQIFPEDKKSRENTEVSESPHNIRKAYIEQL